MKGKSVYKCYAYLSENAISRVIPRTRLLQAERRGGKKGVEEGGRESEYPSHNVLSIYTYLAYNVSRRV